MESVNVKFSAGSMPIISLEQIDVLRQQGKITAEEAQNAKALFNAKNPPKTDEVTVNNSKATPEDEAKAEGSRKAQADEATKLANNKYYSEESEKLPSKEARGAMYGMTEAANKGDYKKAAEYYLKLEKAGVFAEETGVKKPPFAEQMKKEIEAQKAEAQAQFKREAVAENVVRNVNSREGMEALVKSYEGMDTKEEVKEEIGVTGRGAGKVAKNARKNSEHIQRQLNLNTVYVEGKTYEIDGKQMTAEEAKKYQKEQLGDEWDKKRPQVQVMSKEGYAVAEKLNEKAKEMGVSILNEDGSIDIEKAQTVARGIVSIAGDRGDRNELELVAKELGVKEKDVKAFLRGLNIDYKKDKTWLAHTIGGALGAGTAAAAYFTDFMTGGVVTKAVSYIVPGAVNAAVNTTVDNTIEIDHRVGPNGQEYWDQAESSFTTVTTTYTTTPDTVGTKDVKVKPKKGWGDAIGALGMGYTVYDLSTKALKAVFNKDPNILKKDATLADALDDPTKLKKKHNQEVMQYIKDFKIEGYDEATQKQIKLALMEEAMGNNGTGKLNDRELVGIAAALRSIPPKKEETPPPTTTTTTPPTTTPPTTTPPTTTPPTEPETIKGWDRDHGLLKKHGKDGIESNPDGKKNVQIIIGDTKVTGDYEKPDTIEIKDTTDGRENTFSYRRITDDEVKNGQLADGTKLTGLEGKEGPFYLMVDAKDDKGRNIKRNTVEVKQLELKKSEDGKTYDYRLEQYEGMNGYNDRSVTINDNAKGTAVSKPAKKKADTIGKKDTTPTKGKDKVAPKKTIKLKNGAVLRETNNPNVFYDEKSKTHYIKTDGGYKPLPKNVKLVNKDGSWIDTDGHKHPAGTLYKSEPAKNTQNNQGPKMGNGGVPFKPVTIWMNQMPGPFIDAKTGKQRPKTIQDDIATAKSKCKEAGRTLSAQEQAELDKCRNINELKAYLKSIGVNVSFAF